jgi:hypothetical protein
LRSSSSDSYSTKDEDHYSSLGEGPVLKTDLKIYSFAALNDMKAFGLSITLLDGDDFIFCSLCIYDGSLISEIVTIDYYSSNNLVFFENFSFIFHFNESSFVKNPSSVHFDGATYSLFSLISSYS